MWQLITAFLYCEYNYHCYEYHYDYNTKLIRNGWILSKWTAPLIGLCMSQTLPPPSEGCGYARLQLLVFQFFFILLFNSSCLRFANVFYNN